MLWVVLWLAMGAAVAAIAAGKGRSAPLWFFYGAMLWPIALPHAIALPRPDPAPTDDGRRPCPWCAERIQPAAQICPYCRNAVEPESPPVPAEALDQAVRARGDGVVRAGLKRGLEITPRAPDAERAVLALERVEIEGGRVVLRGRCAREPAAFPLADVAEIVDRVAGAHYTDPAAWLLDLCPDLARPSAEVVALSAR